MGVKHSASTKLNNDSVSSISKVNNQYISNASFLKYLPKKRVTTSGTTKHAPERNNNAFTSDCAAVVQSWLNPARNDDVRYHSDMDEKGGGTVAKNSSTILLQTHLNLVAIWRKILLSRGEWKCWIISCD